MTYRATMVVETPLSKVRRTITTRVAGCVDADDARAKLRKLYFVVTFKTVEPVEEQ